MGVLVVTFCFPAFSGCEVTQSSQQESETRVASQIPILQHKLALPFQALLQENLVAQRPLRDI